MGVEPVSFGAAPIGTDYRLSEGKGTGSSDTGSIGFGGTHHGREEAPVAGDGTRQPTTPSVGNNLYYAGESSPSTTIVTPEELCHFSG